MNFQSFWKGGQFNKVLAVCLGLIVINLFINMPSIIRSEDTLNYSNIQPNFGKALALKYNKCYSIVDANCQVNQIAN